MKRIFFIKVFIFLNTISYSQENTLNFNADSIKYTNTDTSKIYNCKQFKKGFYKNYKEFLNNSPSILADFSTKLFYKEHTDSILVGKFALADSTIEIPWRIWGFCDGENVFVRKAGYFNKGSFCKLYNISPHPYFIFYHKDIVVTGLPILDIITVPASLSQPAVYDIWFIANRGGPAPISYKWLKKLFKEDRKLEHDFVLEKEMNDDVKMKYLIKFNENKIRRVSK